MLSSAIFLLLAAANLAAGASTTFAKPTPEATFEPSLSQIAATAATATPLSPQSNVTGVAFDRLIQVWLENTVSLKSSELPDISVFVVLTFPQDYPIWWQRRPKMAGFTRNHPHQLLCYHTSLRAKLLCCGLW
jgi:uncharacterized PurR-regulated membrane protein YhhQ (DUF165 family)